MKSEIINDQKRRRFFMTLISNDFDTKSIQKKTIIRGRSKTQENDTKTIQLQKIKRDRREIQKRIYRV